MGTMTRTTNDNEPDTFRPLAIAVARVVGKLEKIDDPQTGVTDAEQRGGDKSRAKRDPTEDEEFVAKRLRELARFERRAKGEK